MSVNRRFDGLSNEFYDPGLHGVPFFGSSNYFLSSLAYEDPTPPCDGRTWNSNPIQKESIKSRSHVAPEILKEALFWLQETPSADALELTDMKPILFPIVDNTVERILMESKEKTPDISNPVQKCLHSFDYKCRVKKKDICTALTCAPIGLRTLCTIQGVTTSALFHVAAFASSSKRNDQFYLKEKLRLEKKEEWKKIKKIENEERELKDCTHFPEVPNGLGPRVRCDDPVEVFNRNIEWVRLRDRKLKAKVEQKWRNISEDLQDHNKEIKELQRKNEEVAAKHKKVLTKWKKNTEIDVTNWNIRDDEINFTFHPCVTDKAKRISSRGWRSLSRRAPKITIEPMETTGTQVITNQQNFSEVHLDSNNPSLMQTFTHVRARVYDAMPLKHRSSRFLYDVDETFKPKLNLKSLKMATQKKQKTDSSRQYPCDSRSKNENNPLSRVHNDDLKSTHILCCEPKNCDRKCIITPRQQREFIDRQRAWETKVHTAREQNRKDRDKLLLEQCSFYPKTLQNYENQNLKLETRVSAQGHDNDDDELMADLRAWFYELSDCHHHRWVAAQVVESARKSLESHIHAPAKLVSVPVVKAYGARVFFHDFAHIMKEVIYRE